jgi:hypothetical protein
MTFPIFAAGDVLRATDMNAVGLWRVGGGTLSGTAVNFAGCFTSEFTDYRIVVDSLAFSAAGDMYYQYLNGTTPRTTANYYWAYTGLRIDTVASNSASLSTNLGYTGMSSNASGGLMLSSGSMDIYAPQSAARRTFMTSSALGYATDFYHRHGMSGQNEDIVFDGIRFFTNSAVTFTGTVSIYGYRKA